MYRQVDGQRHANLKVSACALSMGAVIISVPQKQQVGVLMENGWMWTIR